MASFTEHVANSHSESSRLSRSMMGMCGIAWTSPAASNTGAVRQAPATGSCSPHGYPSTRSKAQAGEDSTRCLSCTDGCLAWRPDVIVVQVQAGQAPLRRHGLADRPRALVPDAVAAQVEPGQAPRRRHAIALDRVPIPARPGAAGPQSYARPALGKACGCRCCRHLGGARVLATVRRARKTVLCLPMVGVLLIFPCRAAQGPGGRTASLPVYLDL